MLRSCFCVPYFSNPILPGTFCMSGEYISAATLFAIERHLIRGESLFTAE